MKRFIAVLVLALLPVAGPAQAAVTIVFDYSLDTNGFFTTERRAIAQAAANALTSRMINTHWDRIDTTAAGGHYELAIVNPSTFEGTWVQDVVIPENQITIRLGALDWSTIPFAPMNQSSGDGATQLMAIRNVTGGIAAKLASSSQFRPVDASISFDLQGIQGLKPGVTRLWYFGSAANLDTDDRNPADPNYTNYTDFYTSLIHELGHVLGIHDPAIFSAVLPSDPNFCLAWTSRIQSDGVGGFVFTGTHASQFYYNHVGQPIPLDTDTRSHWADGVRSQTANGYTSVTHERNTPFRYGFSELEFGALEDMGYTINGTGVNAVLTVINAGTGSGTVTSTPAGINCPATACAAPFAASDPITLTATAAVGSALISWTGCDTVVGTTCTISSLAASRSVTATFSPAVQRAFVSATGNNANTATFCAVTAPCKTFAAAVTVVADNGEVVALNTAPYGSVTLTRSISLTAAPGAYAGISVFAGSGVTIATPGISVVLRGLTINGQGGANGILVDTPATGTKLSIENCVIANFANAGGAGVAVNAPAQLRVVNTLVRDSFDGISIAGGATAVITGSKILENADTGILVNGASAAVINTVSSASGTGIAAGCRQWHARSPSPARRSRTTAPVFPRRAPPWSR